MNLQQLNYFCEIARTQNMTQSARELHISQPALSGTLKALETELGLSLFDRKGRTIILNDNGKEFLKSVNSIFGILGKNRQKASMIGEGRVEIVIGAVGTELGLISYMNRFMELHPNVAFRTVSHTAIAKMNADETVDFLIGMNPQLHKGRESIRLWPASYCAVYSKGLLVGVETGVSYSDLKPYRFAFCAAPDIKMPRLYEQCIEAGLQPDCAYISDDRISVLSMLLEGKYVGIMPWEDAQTFVGASNKLEMQPLLDQTIQPQGNVFLSWRKDTELSKAAEMFVTYLREEVTE